MSERAPIPPDLAALGWRWNDRGELTNSAITIAWPFPRCFEEARRFDAATEQLRAKRKPKQTRMDL